MHERSCLSICRNTSCHELITNFSSTTETPTTPKATTLPVSTHTSTQLPKSSTTKLSTTPSIKTSKTITNSSTSSSSEYINTTKSYEKTDKSAYHSGASAGMVVSVVLCVCGVVVVGLASKRVYEKHFKKRVNYSYSQLNIESTEGGDADDDYLILPWCAT